MASLKKSAPKTKRKTKSAKPDTVAKPDIVAAPEPVDLAALEVETADIAEVDIKPADLRQGELLDTLSDKTGLRKSDLKSVLAALGGEVGQALSEGRTVKWRELGVLKPTKNKDTPGGPVVVCRLKLAAPTVPVAPAVDAAE